jgi:hypothetical protein
LDELIAYRNQGRSPFLSTIPGNSQDRAKVFEGPAIKVLSPDMVRQMIAPVGVGSFAVGLIIEKRGPISVSIQERKGRRGGKEGNPRRTRGRQHIMKPGGIVTVALQRGDHAGDGAAIAGGILEEFLDRAVETLAQQAEQLAVVLEAQPQHFGDGDDVLADREVAQNLFVEALGKEQGALLVA